MFDEFLKNRIAGKQVKCDWKNLTPSVHSECTGVKKGSNSFGVVGCFPLILQAVGARPQRRGGGGGDGATAFE